MIIIYNLAGLLFGFLGVLLGITLFVLTGNIGVGMIGIGIVWLIYGRSKTDEETGEKKAAPSVFFIPLFFWAFPVILTGAFTGYVQFTMDETEPRPVETAFKADEDQLDRQQISGDRLLSQDIFDHLVSVIREQVQPTEFHVFSRVEADSVLVLVKVPNLKDIAKEAKETLVTEVSDFVSRQPEAYEKQIYVGVKGKLFLGAVKTPSGINVGTTVLPSDLYAFYESVVVDDPSGNPADVADAGESQGGASPAHPASVPAQVTNPTPVPTASVTTPGESSTRQYSGQTEDVIAKCIEDLKSADPKVVSAAVATLNSVPQVSDRQSVADALRPLLASDDRNVPVAFCRWATRDDLKTLIELLDHKERRVPAYALKAIAGFRDPQTVQLLSQCLHVSAAGKEVKEALLSFGAEAEPYLIRQMASDERWAVMSAVDILRESGGVNSIGPLLQLMKKENSLRNQRALRDILTRVAVPVPASVELTADLFLAAPFRGDLTHVSFIETANADSVRVKVSGGGDELVPKSDLKYVPGTPANIAEISRPLESYSQWESVLSDTKLRIGQRIQAQWGSRWYDATVLELSEDGKVKIHWKDYSDSFDEFLPRTRLRMAKDQEPIDPKESTGSARRRAAADRAVVTR